MHVQLEGGCELTEHGTFNVFLRGAHKERAHVDPKEITFIQWVREHYDFIMADDPEATIAGRRILRRMTKGRRNPPRPPLPIIEAIMLGGFKVRLIRMERSGYCVFALEVPFITNNPDAFTGNFGGGGPQGRENEEDERWEEET